MTGYAADINLIKWSCGTGNWWSNAAPHLFAFHSFKIQLRVKFYYLIFDFPRYSSAPYLPLLVVALQLLQEQQQQQHEKYIAQFMMALSSFGIVIKVINMVAPLNVCVLFVLCCSFPSPSLPLPLPLSFSVCACFRISSFRIAHIPFYPLLSFPLWHFIFVCPALSFTFLFLFSVFYFCR